MRPIRGHETHSLSWLLTCTLAVWLLLIALMTMVPSASHPFGSRISTTLASRTSSKALSIVCPPASLSSSLISCLLACPNHRQRSRRISKIFKDLSCACVKSILSTVCTRYSAYVQNNPKVCEGLPHDLSSHRRSRIAVELRAPFSIDCSAIPHKQRGSDRSSRSVMLLWSGLSILSSILR